MNYKLPKINKTKIFGYIIAAILVVTIGYWVGMNSDVALFAISKPSQVRMAKELYQLKHKEADLNYTSAVSVMLSPVGK